jgi:glucuronate isomerase
MGSQELGQGRVGAEAKQAAEAAGEGWPINRLGGAGPGAQLDLQVEEPQSSADAALGEALVGEQVAAQAEVGAGGGGGREGGRAGGGAGRREGLGDVGHQGGLGGGGGLTGRVDLHHQIAKSGFETKVVPTYRPDACLKVRTPDRVQAWAKRLAAATGKGADTFAGLIAGLDQRHDDFAAAGCRASDHGLDYLPDAACTEAEAKAIWENAIAGKAATLEEAEKFTAFIMLHVGRLNHAKGWATQLHLGAVRDPNLGLLKRLGSDAGCDTIGDFRQGPGLIRWFGTLSGENALGKTILYNLNPADTALFACLPGSFQDGVTPGKIQYGSGWWFLDQERGMRDQMNALSDLGLLSRFIGMITDSRSFLSYPRHEYFRRILCDLVGQDVESGRIPDRQDWNERLIADVCYGNASQYFGFQK